jgi:hypothetical protein
MKRSIVFFVLLISLSGLLMVNEVRLTGGVITGEVVTGDVIQDVGLNISVEVATPVLKIKKPSNSTYFHNHSLELNIDTNGDSVWYNFDHGINVTFSEDEFENERKFFNTSAGPHVIYVFSSGTSATTVENVTFTIDFNKYSIDFYDYSGSESGNSNQFNQFSYDELQNLTDVVLEHSSRGKIEFDGIINITNDEDPDDNSTDLSNYTNISFNRIFLNSSALPNFNISASLILYNLDFTTPRILIDGEICDLSVCSQNSYTGGNLSFNVSHFTIFSAEETPGDTGGGNAGGSGGGGGRGGTVITKVDENLTIDVNNFTVDRDIISVSMKQGEVKTEKLVIKNIGEDDIELVLSSSGFRDLIRFSEEEFSISGGGSKVIEIDFISREDEIPNLYLGKIMVNDGGSVKEIMVAIEIVSKKAKFDILVDISRKFNRVLPGEEVVVNIKVFEVEDLGQVDINAEYSIRRVDGSVLISEKETLAINRQANFVKSFNIPNDTIEGEYIFYVKIDYEGSVSSATEFFEVREVITAFTFKLIYISISILIVVLIILLFQYYRMRNRAR